ncbi:methyltransferase domain-containing protein [Candidatus Hydrogenedentota bacterium]
MSKYLVLTCDVEALPDCVATDHVDRLIWGRFPGMEKEAGIGLMMDIADEFGVAITFFLDVHERHLYGDKIDEVGKYILQRGHDLQLHAHPTILPDSFWLEKGYAPPTWANTLYDLTASRLAIGDAVKSFKEIAGSSPLSYRAGAYRYNVNELRALKEAGIRLTSNYYPFTSEKPTWAYGYAEGLLPVFAWDNGLIEVPVGTVRDAKRDKYIGFGYHNFKTAKKMLRYMDEFWKIGPDRNVLVLVLHSWAFLYRKRSGHFVYKNERNTQRFRDFLSRMPEDVTVISLEGLLQRIDAGEIIPEMEKPIAVAGTSCAPLMSYKKPDEEPTGKSGNPRKAKLQESSRKTEAGYLAKNLARIRRGFDRLRRRVRARIVSPTQMDDTVFRSDTCNVCGGPEDQFTDFGGRKNVKCRKCLALERQRIFKWTYDVFMKREFSFDGKEILVCTPSDAERDYILNKAKKLVSFDIRPSRWFDLQLDISDMNTIEDSSFDCVVAIAVMQHVKREKEAVDEVYRVLRPGGRFLVQASNHKNVATKSCEDQTKHYGQEALDKYGVGTYRIYGDLALISLLARRFVVKTFHGIDPVTGSQDFIVCGIKRPE